MNEQQQRIAERLSTLPPISPYEPMDSPLRNIKDALREAYLYGAKDGNRNQAAETRIAKAVAEALNMDAKHVKAFLDSTY